MNHKHALLKTLIVSGILLNLVWLSSCSKDDDKDPVVTADEGLYINEIYASGDDWIELYNSGDELKDISGYRIFDDVANKYTLPNSTHIEAKGYLVLHCDDTGTGLNTNFKLSSSGETVYLENKSNEVIDKVEFPALDNGQTYGRYPDGSTNLKVSGIVTKGTSNGDSNAPAIDNVVRTPMVPTKSNPVTFEATLVSNTGITSVKLFHRINGGTYTESVMTLSGGKYSVTIPAANALGKVEYYVEAKNGSGQTGYKPFDAPGDAYYYLINEDALPNLKINEFLASNSSCCPDNDSGTPEYDDWIEIYNAGASAVDIAGMYLSDDPADPFKSKIPATNSTLTTIQPGGFLLLWADGTKSQGVRHLDFSLSADGETVGIYYIDGRKIDERDFGAQTENRSSGRSPNGGDSWVIFNPPTPGTTNNP
ncbi:MAG TPA: lamin tail domain-containing protein [Ohtaekwangia sp.]